MSDAERPDEPAECLEGTPIDTEAFRILGELEVEAQEFEEAVSDWEQELLRLCRVVWYAVSRRPYEGAWLRGEARRKHFLDVATTLERAQFLALSCAGGDELPDLDESESEDDGEQDEETATCPAPAPTLEEARRSRLTPVPGDGGVN